MNERIRQLLNEATVGLEPDLSTPTTITLNELNKFAELIVLECYYIMQKYSKANMESDSWVEMINMMQKELQEHFGVEE